MRFLKKFFYIFFFNILWEYGVIAEQAIIFNDNLTAPKQASHNTSQPNIQFERKKSLSDKSKSKLLTRYSFWPSSHIYLHFRNKPAAAAITDFCTMQNIDAVLSNKVLQNTQHINQSFEKAYPVNIWEQLVKSCGLMWFYDGHVLYVYASGEIQTKIFKIHPLQIDPLFKIINAMGFQGSNMGIHPMREGGLIIASGAPKMMELLEVITSNIQLYKPSEINHMDVKIFYLKHAWADDKTIGNLVIPGIATLFNRILGKQEKNSNTLASVPPPVSAKKVDSVKKTTERLESDDKKNKVEESNASNETNSDQNKNPIPPEGGLITIDARQNAIIVKDYPHNFHLYEHLVKQLDVPLDLIEIQAAIINVSKGCDFTVGTQGITIKTPHHTQLLQYVPQNTAKYGLKGNINGIVNSIEFATALHLLESKNLSKILARPSVITMNNLAAVMNQSKTYYFQVKGLKGGDMYSITGSTQLKVTPHLFQQNGKSCIQLVLDIRDESISPGSGDEKANTDSSSILTQAVVYEGQSVLVGGYFHEGYQYDDSGIPILKDIPILGHLFKNYANNKSVSERLFLITPRIIRLSADDPYKGVFKKPSSLLDDNERLEIAIQQQVTPEEKEISKNQSSNKNFLKNSLQEKQNEIFNTQGMMDEEFSADESEYNETPLKKHTRAAMLYRWQHK